MPEPYRKIGGVVACRLDPLGRPQAKGIDDGQGHEKK